MQTSSSTTRRSGRAHRILDSILFRIYMPASLEKGSLLYWRECILFAFYASGTTLGLLAYIPGTLLMIRTGRWEIAVANTVAFFCAIAMLVSPRRFRFVFRSTAAVVLIYLVGIGVLHALGPFSGGLAWLFAFGVSAGLLLGIRAALVALLVNVVSLLVMGCLLQTGAYEWIAVPVNAASRWWTLTVNVIFLNALTSISIATILRGLENAAERLQNERNRLLAAKDHLAREIDGRRQTEAALKRSEQQVRLLLNSVAEAVYVLDQQGRCTFVNTAFLKLMGYPEAEALIGQPLHPLIHHTYSDGQPYPESECQVCRTCIDGQPCHADNEVFWRSDGSQFPVEYWAYPIWQDERLEGAVISLLDISDRHAAAAELKARTQRLKETGNLLESVLNAIPDVIGVQDRHHRILRYNAAGYRLLGKTPQEVHGRKCHELIGQDNVCNVCATAETYRTQRAARTEKYVPTMDRWFDMRGYPVFDEDGQMVQVIEHMRDITHEKAAAQALRESEERFRQLAQNIDDVFWIREVRSRAFLYVSPAFERIWQRATHELQADPDVWTRFIHPDDLAAVQANQALQTQGRQTVEEFRIQRPDGSQRWIANRSYPVADHLQQVHRVVGIAEDISTRKEALAERQLLEKKLQQARRMEAIGTLAGGIAHDFNNLLMGIQGRASLVLMDLEEGDDPVREHLEGIEHYVKNASSLTRQLLGFARGGKYEVRPVVLNDLIVHSSQMFGRTRKEIGIHLDLEKRLWPVEVDSSQMDQVLLNLFVNAWQAMPGGGQLFVRTENVTIGPNGVKTFGLKPGRYVRVTVTDTGIGMDDSTQEKIFDPFFTTKEKGRGTGLGLASAYGIVQNHGGIITVDSTVGQGASFFLLLPATDRLPSVVSKKAPPKVATGSGNILLVDDEEMVLEVGGKMIERLGYTVTAASGGEEALAHYQRSGADIDLVILDMVMPGMDGSETFARLKALDPGVKVLLASGYAIGDRAAAIMKQGCLGFIPKPFNLDYLSQKINQVLEQGETAN